MLDLHVDRVAVRISIDVAPHDGEGATALIGDEAGRGMAIAPGDLRRVGSGTAERVCVGEGRDGAAERGAGCGADVEAGRGQRGRDHG